MSRRKRRQRIPEPTPPKPPRRPERLPIVVPDERLRPEYTQPASDRTRTVPCVRQGRVDNSPGSNITGGGS
jgi:hypothetical protein